MFTIRAALLLLIGLPTLLQAAVLVNRTPNDVEYLLQENCAQVTENGSIAGQKGPEPSRQVIGKTPSEASTEKPLWCLTLTSDNKQEATVVKLGSLEATCRIIMLEKPTNIVVSKDCKSPEENGKND